MRLILGILVVVATAWNDGSVRAQTVVRDGPSCSSCRINVQVLGHIGEAEGPGSLSGAPSSPW